MERNSDLLRKVADRIEAHPELYDQSTYCNQSSCGTYACIAGHTLLEMGYQVRGYSYYPPGVALPSGPRVDYSLRVDPRDTAGDLLGLTDDERAILFAGGWAPPSQEESWKAADPLLTAAYLRELADGAEMSEASRG